MLFTKDEETSFTLLLQSQINKISLPSASDKVLKKGVKSGLVNIRLYYKVNEEKIISLICSNINEFLYYKVNEEGVIFHIMNLIK